MKQFDNYPCHQCAPKEWRKVKDMSGSYELDGMIARTKNCDMWDRLENHLMTDVAYKINTSYGRGPIG